MLNILVIHGYVQSAATVAHNTRQLRDALDDVAILHYVDGPPVSHNIFSSSSLPRPWWFLDQNLELDSSQNDRARTRWENVVEWWSKELSEHEYDGVIGLSQGSAMAALLLSMANHPERVSGFNPTKKQNFKFGIFCSGQNMDLPVVDVEKHISFRGLVSRHSPHAEIYGIPDIPTLHTLDDGDTIVSPARTLELQQKCRRSVLYRHSEGHVIPVGGNFPSLFRDFILDATK